MAMRSRSTKKSLNSKVKSLGKRKQLFVLTFLMVDHKGLEVKGQKRQR
jgi:hypothetical protein